MDDVLKIAKNCRHYEMCKIDFLGSGVCASGLEKHYVSYYLQGRMDLYAALAERKLSVTERCVDMAASCDLCGKWDYQCYFVAELRPSLVMEALKNLVAAHVQGGGVAKGRRRICFCWISGRSSAKNGRQTTGPSPSTSSISPSNRI